MATERIVVAASAGYVVILAVVSFAARRFGRTASSYTTGGVTYPAVLIGFMLMSEFIGTTASVGTAQEGYVVGLSAAWNVAAIGIGFVLYALVLARRFKDGGDNTISGALARVYGHRVRVATSLSMICALQIVAISTYASGGAVLAPLLAVDRATAVVIAGVVGVLYVSVGGMGSVIYTNVIHAILKYLSMMMALALAVSMAGGIGHIGAVAPGSMFTVAGVGWSQVFAWLVAGVGAVFSTQYVVQAVSAVPDGARATRASFYAAVLLIPFGVAAAGVGVAAAVAFPGIRPIAAFPEVVGHMDAIPAAIVVAGLTGALLGTMSALNIAAATLVYKDFFLPLTGRSGDDAASLRFVRLATVAVGLLPIPLAILSERIVAVTFLAKSVRASLAVLVLLVFYAPRFGTGGGALVTIVAALLGTIAWYLAGNPFGIDNAYVAVVIPLVVMTASHVLPSRPTNVAAAGARPTLSPLKP